MFKKIVSLLLVAVMCASLFGCSDKENEEETTATEEKKVKTYEDEDMWYSCGRTIDKEKPDVFYIVSTVLLTSYDENGNETKFANLNEDDKNAMDEEISDLATNTFTDEFNFFAPYYHEVTMNTYMNATTEEVAEMVATAQAEINEAFDYYYARKNNGRPFIIVGYSQGAVLAKGLVKHLTDKQLENMAAAYIMGGPITTEDLENENIKVATGAEDLHVVVSFNSVSSTDACWAPLTATNVNCINPVNWKTDATPATFTYKGTEVTVHVDEDTHVLVVEGLNAEDYYLDGWPFPLGNYHCEEIHFYASYIRENALLRLKKLVEYQNSTKTWFC